MPADTGLLSDRFPAASRYHPGCVITRLGLLAFLATTIFSTWGHIPLTTDPNSWFFASSVMTMIGFAAVAVYGFVVSVGGRVAFTERVLDS